MYISFVLCYVLFMEGDNLSSLVRARPPHPPPPLHSVRTVVKSLIWKANQFLFFVPLLKNATIFFYFIFNSNQYREGIFQYFWRYIFYYPFGEAMMVQWCENNSPPLMWRPGVEAICGFSLLLVLSLAPRGCSSGTPVFPSPQKPTFSNSNLTWNTRSHELKRVLNNY